MLHGESYEFDPTGMRTRIAYQSDSTFAPFEKLFAYDKIGQMTEEHARDSGNLNTLYRQAYTFDAAGNRTAMESFNGVTTSTTTYTVNNMNQVTASAGKNYTYDLQGSLATRGSDTYTHNGDQYLASATVSGQTTQYIYDAVGRRLMRTAPQRRQNQVLLRRPPRNRHQRQGRNKGTDPFKVRLIRHVDTFP